MLGAWPWAFLRDTQTIETIRNIVLAAAIPPSVVMGLWRASVAQKNADTARRDSNTARRVLHNNRFQEGVRMLTGPTTVERAAGLSALWHLVLADRAQYLAPVTDMLATFIRHHAGTDSQFKRNNCWESDLDCVSSGAGYGTCPHQPRVEIVEAVKALSDCLAMDARTPDQMHRHVDLRHIDLHGLRMDRLCLVGVDLTGSTLMHSQIVGARFRDSILEHVNLSESNLGNAEFCNARLLEATFDHSRLVAARFIGADLQSTTFVRANAERAYFCLSDCFGVHFAVTQMSECHFESSPTTIDLRCRRCLRESIAKQTNLLSASFHGSILAHATFGNATITDVDFGPHRVSGRPEEPIRGLSRSQLADVQFDPHRPPTFYSVIDAETGEQLAWRDHPVSD